MTATAEATMHNTCVRCKRITSSAKHVSSRSSMCDCATPLQCRECFAAAKSAVVDRLAHCNQLSLTDVHELLSGIITVHVRFMLKNIIAECDEVFRVGDMLQSSIYYAENTLASEANPVHLIRWAANLGVPEMAVQRLINRESKVSGRVHVWREETGWYGRGATALNITNAHTLLAHLKRKGVKGTPLSDIYSEYELAYKDVHQNSAIYICEGHAWHEVVACHNENV